MYTVSGVFVTTLVEWLEGRGYGSTAVCRRLRSLKPEDKVSLQDLQYFLRQAVHLSGDPLAPVKAGLAVRWDNLGALGHMLKSSRTLEELLYGYVAYEKFFYGQNVANVTRNQSSVELYWPVQAVPREVAELTLSAFVAITRSVSGGSDVVAAVGFPFKEDRDAGSYQQLFSCAVDFEAPLLSISFENSSLYRVIHITDGGDLRAVIARLVPEMKNEAFRTQLCEEIFASLPRRSATLGNIAQQMAVSQRTLQRRLKLVPDGLRGLVSRLRMYQAEEYLRDAGLPMSSIALLLGYSEQSAFNLAFKKYVGVSPGAWRRMSRNSE